VERDAQQSTQDRPVELGSKHAEIFEALARTAESIAETEDKSAVIHDSASAHLPGASEHAARARRFEDTELAAASAYRKHEIPPHDVRQAIRQSRPDTDDH
jgi:hypothetical protein